MTSAKSNYPGGYTATRINVFLYADGRQNFDLDVDANLGSVTPDPEDHYRNARQCVRFKSIDVTGMDFGEIIQAANKTGDELRGCTWEEFQTEYRTELTPAGEQHVIPGCERNASPAIQQLDLF